MKSRLSTLLKLGFIFLCWRVLLWGVEWLSPAMWPLREGYLGFTRWANFDGVHYLVLIDHGYKQFLEGFFPFYPILSRILSELTPLLPHESALYVSHVSLFLGIILLHLIATKLNKVRSYWPTIFLLSFPTSFFFAGVYTESLYFFLSALSIYSVLKKRWWIAAIIGAFASATRLNGVYLVFPLLFGLLSDKKNIRKLDYLSICVIPLGLVSFMIYLSKSVGDPLAFVHVQKIFAVGRSTESIVMVPQTIWRYMKILMTIDPREMQFAIALLELSSLSIFSGLLLKAWKDRYPIGIIIYSACALLTPTLTGTLISFPRYMLVNFPLFVALSSMHNTRIRLVVIVWVIGLVVITSAFLQGYFVG